MRVFLDTNVWISSLLASGNPSEIVDYCTVEHILLVSKKVLDELEKTLKRKLRINLTDANDYLAWIRENCELVDEGLLPAICRDPDDNHILAAAKAGAADCLVTGDNDLLELRRFKMIPILRPAAFWKFEKEFKS